MTPTTPGNYWLTWRGQSCIVKVRLVAGVCAVYSQHGVIGERDCADIVARGAKFVGPIKFGDSNAL